MIPKIHCTQCGGEISRADTFCSSCGSKIEWNDAEERSVVPEQKKTVRDSHSTKSCPLCGHQNVADRSTCESCGAFLQASQPPSSDRNSRSKPSGASLKSVPVSFFQSGKFTALIGIVLVGLIIVFSTMKKGETPVPVPVPGNRMDSATSGEIVNLQKYVDANPGDAASMLKLANMYYDSKSYAQAIMMYNKYLKLEPTNADARVDMGIAYFGMSFLDSVKSFDYLMTAKEAMETALKYSPKHQLAHFNLGIINLHAGDAQAAGEWFKKCIAIDPNSETGKRAQQILSQHQFTNRPSS